MVRLFSGKHRELYGKSGFEPGARNLGGTEAMSGKLSSLRRRLAKVEQAAAQAAEREKLTGCICKFKRQGCTIAVDREQFEAEINRPRPVHGLRIWE